MNDRRRAAFTLLELLTVIIVVGILATLVFPAFQGIFKKSDGVKCMGQMRSLHASLSAYVTDRNQWPQQPESTASGKSAAAWWIDALKPYGAPFEVWLCPGVLREIHEGRLKESEVPMLHYVPTQFDEKRFTPFRWSTQPWMAEIFDHGDGAHFIFPDGSIKTFNELYEASTGQKIR